MSGVFVSSMQGKVIVCTKAHLAIGPKGELMWAFQASFFNDRQTPIDKAVVFSPAFFHHFLESR
jgi:hypothetical protein